MDTPLNWTSIRRSYVTMNVDWTSYVHLIRFCVGSTLTNCCWGSHLKVFWKKICSGRFLVNPRNTLQECLWISDYFPKALFTNTYKRDCWDFDQFSRNNSNFLGGCDFYVSKKLCELSLSINIESIISHLQFFSEKIFASGTSFSSKFTIKPSLVNLLSQYQPHPLSDWWVVVCWGGSLPRLTLYYS